MSKIRCDFNVDCGYITPYHKKHPSELYPSIQIFNVMVNYKCKFSTKSHFINQTYVKTNKQYIVIFWQKKRRYAKKYAMILAGSTILSLLITVNIHLNYLGLYWCIYPNPVSEKKMSYFTSYKQLVCLLLLNLYLVLPSWYCIISALLLQHLTHQQSPI